MLTTLLDDLRAFFEAYATVLMVSTRHFDRERTDSASECDPEKHTRSIQVIRDALVRIRDLVQLEDGNALLSTDDLLWLHAAGTELSDAATDDDLIRAILGALDEEREPARLLTRLAGFLMLDSTEQILSLLDEFCGGSPDQRSAILVIQQIINNGPLSSDLEELHEPLVTLNDFCMTVADTPLEEFECGDPVTFFYSQVPKTMRLPGVPDLSVVEETVSDAIEALEEADDDSDPWALRLSWRESFRPFEADDEDDVLDDEDEDEDSDDEEAMEEDAEDEFEELIARRDGFVAIGAALNSAFMLMLLAKDAHAKR